MTQSSSKPPIPGNRSNFIRKLLSDNPKTSLKEAQTAWNEQGHAEMIMPALFYNIKGRMGLGRKRRRQARGNASATREPRASSNGTASSYLEIEQTLDRLLREAQSLGNVRLVDDLRQARRRASFAILRKE